MPSKKMLFTTAASVKINFDEHLQRMTAQRLAYPWLYERTPPPAPVTILTQKSPAERRAASKADYAPFYN